MEADPHVGGGSQSVADGGGGVGRISGDACADCDQRGARNCAALLGAGVDQLSEWRARCDCAGAAELLKRDFRGLGHVQHGLIAGALLPGGSDGLDFGAIGRRVGIVDDQHLGAQALRAAHGLALPLSIAVEDAEAVGEARCDFLVEEVAPAGLGDAGFGVHDSRLWCRLWGCDLWCAAESEIEAGVDPALGVSGVRGVAREGGALRGVRVICDPREGKDGDQDTCKGDKACVLHAVRIRAARPGIRDRVRHAVRHAGGAKIMMASVMPTNRRDFLRSGAVAAAVAATSTTVSAPWLFAQPKQDALKESPIKLGIASYTFREFDRAHVIDWMKELKVANLNAKDVKDHLPMSPAEATEAAVAAYTAAGIKLTAAGTVYFPKDEDEDIRAKFDYAKRAGVKVIVAGDPTPQTLPRIEKFVKEYDIKFAIHNHGPEDKIWPSPLDVLKAVKGMDPRMGCCIDVGHCVRAGTDVVEAIHTVGPRLFDVHMKDLTDFTSKESQVAVGDGIMPVRGIFEALSKIKYPGYLDLEYEVHGDDPMPGVTKSFAYMRGVLDGMGYRG